MRVGAPPSPRHTRWWRGWRTRTRRHYGRREVRWAAESYQRNAQKGRKLLEYGALYVGSPETVARKIAATAGSLSLTRFDLKYSAGPLPHAQLMRSIELYVRRVIPLVRELLG